MPTTFSGRDAADGQRRRIRSEHRARRLPFRVAQGVLLELQILEHRLDDHVARLEAGPVGRARDESQLLLAFARREAAALHPLLEDRFDLAQSATKRRVILVLEPHRNARVRRDVRDPGAHQPRAHHAHLRDGRRLHGRVVHSRVLLQRGGGEEDFDEPPGDIADDELAEVLRLDTEALLDAVLDPDADRVQRFLRGRVLTARLPYQSLTRLLKEDAAADGVLFERDRL
jgi:hypothetical protein